MPEVSVTVTDKSGQSATTSAAYSVSAPTSELNLPRVAWEGGPQFWSKFPKASAAGWTSPDFFPIAVFLSNAWDADKLKQVGVNTYQAMNHLPESLTYATDRGMFVLPQQNEWTQAQVGDNPNCVGWFVSDECEMGYSDCGTTQEAQIAKQREYVAKCRGYADGRFLQANFGNGVARTWWSPTYFDEHVQLMDCSSADKYCYASPDAAYVIEQSLSWPSPSYSAIRSAAYGWMCDQIRKGQDPADPKPVWTFVEVAKPLATEVGARTITLDELEGAIWSSIIHEARGVCYFQHNNDAENGTYALVDGTPERKARVTSINSKIKSLAPVLNTQSYVHNFGSVDTMLKAKDGYAYIFAGVGVQQSPGSKTFTLPPGVSGTTVEVLFESRFLPVTNGTFTDSFAAEYSSHIYKIAL